MIFYFSGTGNSAWVARRLADKLQETLVAIPEVIEGASSFAIKEGEKVGFVFPVYAWAPPRIVTDFIACLKLDNPSYLYFVCTCGDDTGKTAEVFCKALKSRNWMCNAGFSITMPNTYVSFPGFDVDDKDLERRKVENARSRVDFIAEELERKVQMSGYNCHEGSIPFLKTYAIRPLFNAFLMSPNPFHAADACISCGLCEKRCPVHNIKVEGKPQWGDDCTMCMACYHACPVNAIQYGDRTKGKGQYKGEHLD